MVQTFWSSKLLSKVQALHRASSKCTNRKTTPRMVSTRLDFTEKINFQINQIPTEHSRRWKVFKTPFDFIYKWSYTICNKTIGIWRFVYSFFSCLPNRDPCITSLTTFKVLCFSSLIFFLWIFVGIFHNLPSLKCGLIFLSPNFLFSIFG